MNFISTQVVERIEIKPTIYFHFYKIYYDPLTFQRAWGFKEYKEWDKIGYLYNHRQSKSTNIVKVFGMNRFRHDKGNIFREVR